MIGWVVVGLVVGSLHWYWFDELVVCWEERHGVDWVTRKPVHDDPHVI